MKGWFDADGRLVSLTSEDVEGVTSNDTPLVSISGLHNDLPLDRTFCVNGHIVVYSPVLISVPTRAVSTDEPVVVTAIVPPDSPDGTVKFQVNDVLIDEVLVQDGKAETVVSFRRPGTYRIAASSFHHGTTTAEVIVQ